MSDVRWALDALAARAPDYRLKERYYGGDHRLVFATERFYNAFGNLFRAFADNLCRVVVNTVASRLEVIGFSPEEGDEAAADTAWEIWQQNRMDQKSKAIHKMALCAGDAYLVLWPDESGAIRMHPNSALRVAVAYNDEQPGVIDTAARLWRQGDGRLRLNLYYPDRIEKYATTQAPTGVYSEGAFRPLDGQPTVPNPWGVVPVIHFANDTEEGGFGRSELEDVIPLQDALNKAVADMLVAMEYVALPQRWATGLEVDTDPATGKPKVPFTPGVERVWAVGDPDVRFGQFDPANLAQFLDVQNGFRMEIARVSGIPLHYLLLDAGGWPSGEAMKTAEARLTSKVQDMQAVFGNSWEDAFHLALKMLAGDDGARLSTLWTDPAPRDVRVEAETAILRQQLGVSQKQILRELGYSPEQIEQMSLDKEASSASIGEHILTAFDRGM